MPGETASCPPLMTLTPVGPTLGSPRADIGGGIGVGGLAGQITMHLY